MSDIRTAALHQRTLMFTLPRFFCRTAGRWRSGLRRQTQQTRFDLRKQPMQSRRKFIQIVPVAGASLLAARTAFAQAAKLEEGDAQAKALGYLHDATKVDKAKQPKYAAGQACNNCQLFQGKPADA
jgi:hypothetical protein